MRDLKSSTFKVLRRGLVNEIEDKKLNFTSVYINL